MPIFFLVYFDILYLLVYFFASLTFSILFYSVKKQDKKFLKIAVAAWSLVILFEGISLFWNLSSFFVVLFLIKFVPLIYLLAPFNKKEKKKLWEKGLSEIPYVLPIITLLPFFAIFYITFLITDNAFYSSLAYLPPILFLLTWLYFSSKRKIKSNVNQ